MTFGLFTCVSLPIGRTDQNRIRFSLSSIRRDLIPNMFKVAWPRLCVYSDGCTTECMFRAYARPSAHFGNAARLFATHDSAHGSDGRVTRLFVGTHVRMDASTIRMQGTDWLRTV